MTMDPEELGRLMAERLVGGLEQLKREATDTHGSLESQIAAGQAAVEAMKQLLGPLADDLRGS